MSSMIIRPHRCGILCSEVRAALEWHRQKSGFTKWKGRRFTRGECTDANEEQVKDLVSEPKEEKAAGWWPPRANSEGPPAGRQVLTALEGQAVPTAGSHREPDFSARGWGHVNSHNQSQDFLLRCVRSMAKAAQATDMEETSRGFLNCCVLELCSFKIHSQDVHHISRKKKIEDDSWHPINEGWSWPLILTLMQVVWAEPRHCSPVPPLSSTTVNFQELDRVATCYVFERLCKLPLTLSKTLYGAVLTQGSLHMRLI